MIMEHVIREGFILKKWNFFHFPKVAGSMIEITLTLCKCLMLAPAGCPFSLWEPLCSARRPADLYQVSVKNVLVAKFSFYQPFGSTQAPSPVQFSVSSFSRL